MSDDWRTNKHAVSSTIAKASSPAGPFLMRTEGDPITADSRWTRLASSRGTPETNHLKLRGNGISANVSNGSVSTRRIHVHGRSSIGGYISGYKLEMAASRDGYPVLCEIVQAQTQSVLCKGPWNSID